MKTNFRNFFSVLAVVAMVGTAALMSCSKDNDEVTPIPEETTEDTIEKAYYITGVVTTASGTLSGVTVTSGSASETTDGDGVYTLKMSSKSTATVSFSMDGYVAIDATAVFASDATAGSAVTLSQQLTAQVAAQEAAAGEESTLTFVQDSDDSDSSTADESVVTVSIPADALTESVDISATVYTPSATESTAEAIADALESSSSSETVTVTSSIVAIDLQPSGTTFETPITVSVTGDYVAGAYHAKLVDGEWVRQSDEDLVYNEATGAYELELTGFSSHSVTVDAEVEIVSSSSSASSTETLTTAVFDNIGLVSVVTDSVSYDQKSGWSLSSGASNVITSFASGIMGSSAGVSTITKSMDVTVAGDEKVTVTVTQQVVTTTFTLGDESATASSYGNVSVDITTEQGDMRTDHNN